MVPTAASALRSRRLQLWLIPLLAGVIANLIGAKSLPFTSGYHLPWELWVTLMVFTTAIWEVHLFGYRYLDRRLPFSLYPARRVSMQVAGSWLVTWVTFTGLMLALFSIYGQPFNLDTYLRFLAVALSIATLVNGLYVVYHLLTALTQPDTIQAPEPGQLPQAPSDVVASSLRVSSLMIASGSRMLQIGFDQIAYMYASDGFVLLMKTTGQLVPTQYQSLITLAGILPQEIFFQVNRNYILHYQCILSIADDTNRKLLIEITPTLQQNQPLVIGVSRYRRIACKQWFKERLRSD